MARSSVAKRSIAGRGFASRRESGIDRAVEYTASGGNGGYVDIGGNNTAAITARGGDVLSTGTVDSPTGGSGGTVIVDGTNSACIDVTPGTPAGSAGTITPADLPNFCG